jgi:hypothetical protein
MEIRLNYKEEVTSMWSFTWEIKNAEQQVERSKREGIPLTSHDIARTGQQRWRLVFYPSTGGIYVQLRLSVEPVKVNIM